MYKYKEEFITRTREIVKNCPQDRKVTLLVNCMLGLLVFPHEKHPELIKSAPYTDWGINEGSITICKAAADKQYCDSKDIVDVVEHLRNAVTHSHFDMKGEEQITHIEFKDFPNGDETKALNFKARISVEELEPFLLNFSQTIVKGH